MSGVAEIPAAIPAARRRRRRITIERVAGLVSLPACLAVWEICSRTGLFDPRFFPAPSTIAVHAVALTQSGELGSNLAASLRRLVLGSLVGGVPALLLGLAMGLWRPLRAAIDPLIAATYPVPKSSLLPLILLVFGLGEASKIVMVAIGVFYPLLINTAVGVAQIPPIYRDVGRSFGASTFNTFRTVALPGALPLIMTGLRLGLGLGLVLIAIAEMVGAKSGLGYLIWSSWEIFDVEGMYVGLVVIAAIGFLIHIVLIRLEAMLVPWRQA